MSQTGVKNNMKFAPLRMCELLAEIQEMKQRQEDDERGNSSSPDRSYSDSEDHNRGFYNSHKPDITYPSSRAPKEQYLSDSQYNQTYPSNNSASKSKLGKSTAATPMRTPGKCKQSGSLIKSLKLKTPRSSAKKKTPHIFKSSGKKTPFRKCLNMEDAFKSTKCSLFSSSKLPPTNSQNASEDHADEISKVLLPVPAVTLDEVFASSLHITDERKYHDTVAPHSERINPFKFNTVQAKSEVFATPKSCNISSNLLKGCRENNFITPLKPSDLSGLQKFETPSTQNKVIPYKSQHTPLVSINERATPSSQQVSHKKNILSVKRDKENEASRASWQRNGLFNKGDEIINRTPKQLSSALKENQHNIVEPKIRHNEIDAKLSDPPMFLNNILNKEAHSENFKHENQNSKKFPPNHLQYTSAIKQTIVSQTPQKDQINQIASRNYALPQSHQKERIPINNPVTVPDYSKPVSIFPPKSNLDEIHQLGQYANQTDKACDLDRLLASMNGEYKSTLQGVPTSESCPRPLGQALPRQFRSLILKGTQYTVLGKIGCGGSSEVFKVMNPEDSSMYAVKCVNLAVDQPVALGYINEIKLLQRLQGSDRVITMYDYEYMEKQRMLYVLLEMGDVDLSSLMKGYRARESRLPLPILVCYWTEMLSAVHHIHQHGIIHSDLKPANFLLAHGRLKLIDFGIASVVSADATSVFKNCTAGTFNYISPEAVNAGTGGREPMKISYKSDVWSLGCILYSMLYGRTPFSHVRHIAAKAAVLSNPNHVITYPELEGVPPVLMKALRWCLTHNVKLRPTVQQLMDLPYIGGSAPGRVPLPIMAKVRAALTEDEWKKVLEVLEGK